VKANSGAGVGAGEGEFSEEGAGPFKANSNETCSEARNHTVTGTANTLNTILSLVLFFYYSLLVSLSLSPFPCSPSSSPPSLPLSPLFFLSSIVHPPSPPPLLLLSLNPSSLPPQGNVHVGMYTGALAILNGYGMLDYISDLAARGYDVKIVGHSLGAGTTPRMSNVILCSVVVCLGMGWDGMGWGGVGRFQP
jgi:hypothetical protein